MCTKKNEVKKKCQESRQERTFIHKCLAHHSTFVSRPLSRAAKKCLTGQPEVSAALIGKGILIMQLIGL